MKAILSFILIILTLPAFAQNSVLRQGNKAYDKGKFGQAFELYEKASPKTPEKAAYNSGTALYRLQDYSAAADAFENAITEPKDKKQVTFNQNALYNLGNAAYKAGDKETAKQAMRAAILHNLNDKDAKHNLQFMLKEEKAQKDSNQPKENPKQNKDNKQDQQNQDKQNQNQNQEQKQEQKEKEASAKDEAESVLQMAQEHRQDLPQAEQRSNQIEKDW